MDSDDDLPQIRYVAIGDSFSEGVGDERADGTMRGWADLAAQRWADALGAPIAYANVAIRGKLIEHIALEQLETALALGPTHVSLNGGGNDMLRPRADLERILALTEQAVERCADAGVHLLLLSGGNPCARLPFGRRFQQRGDALSYAIEDRFAGAPNLMLVQNWFDETLAEERFWSQDRLHMNTRGHHRVAARLLEYVGAGEAPDWWDCNVPTNDGDDGNLRGLAYYRAHVGPWVKRRLTGTSSGDGLSAKHPTWVELAPARV